MHPLCHCLNKTLMSTPIRSPSPHTGYRIFEAPQAGFNTFRGCNLGSGSSNSNPFRTCSSSGTNRLLAVETDTTCVVRVFVLGDST